MYRQGYDAGIYEQTILVNGVQQRDIVIATPAYPDPFSDGAVITALPPSVIRARPDLVFPTNRGSRSVSISRSRRSAGFARRTRGSAATTCSAAATATRRSTACAPIRRPQHHELETTARSANRSLELDLQLKYPSRRLSANLAYTLGSAWNETDGPFQLPPNSLDLFRGMGTVEGDVRHRFNAGVNADLWSGFRITRASARCRRRRTRLRPDSTATATARATNGRPVSGATAPAAGDAESGCDDRVGPRLRSAIRHRRAAAEVRHRGQRPLRQKRVRIRVSRLSASRFSFAGRTC
jgi:hypothetical protein